MKPRIQSLRFFATTKYSQEIRNMQLLDLPPEIIGHIAQHLERYSDFDKLCRTSRHLHHILNPLLYAKDAKHKSRALLWGANKGDVSIMRMSLDRGANINIRATDDKLNTPLSLAAENGNTAVAELLLAHGADVNILCWGRRIPLQLAAEKRHPDMVKLLVKNGSRIPAQDDTPVRKRCCGVGRSRPPLRGKALRAYLASLGL